MNAFSGLTERRPTVLQHFHSRPTDTEIHKVYSFSHTKILSVECDLYFFSSWFNSAATKSFGHNTKSNRRTHFCKSLNNQFISHQRVYNGWICGNFWGNSQDVAQLTQSLLSSLN
jgi:hypothetical protein